MKSLFETVLPTGLRVPRDNEYHGIGDIAFRHLVGQPPRGHLAYLVGITIHVRRLGR
ncbi:hypothetical protein Acor_07890 [Acrocarpospora corrugata]|uniref:Uncharacterized protein n=1 Tax=Acrocarpospora corrugata TaxID=35763 RepID=A0A5M3VPL2_9ACTN|nr:hypothetical protein Acor_07890 [Acrocarpospora corrugata]